MKEGIGHLEIVEHKIDLEWKNKIKKRDRNLIFSTSLRIEKKIARINGLAIFLTLF